MKGFKAMNVPLNITLAITHTSGYTEFSIFPNDSVTVISFPL